MKTTDFSNASVAFADLSQLLNAKEYFDALKKRKNKANSKGRMRRVLNVIRHIKKIIRKQGLYGCVVVEIYDSSLRRITKSTPVWYDTTWHDDRILALRFLQSQDYAVVVYPQWANSPSYCKGELFYMNMTRISISQNNKEEEL